VRADGRAADELRPVKLAANYIPHAEGSVLIEVGYERQLLTMRVKDDGRGLAAGMQGNSNGNGMGLMRQRAIRHGGELTVSGPPGEGTTIRLRVRVK